MVSGNASQLQKAIRKGQEWINQLMKRNPS